MLSGINKQRLDQVTAILKQYNLRFPVSEVIKRTGFDKGNVSVYLKGKKPMSTAFYEKFISAFNLKDAPVLAGNHDIKTELQIITDLLIAIAKKAGVNSMELKQILNKK